MKFSQGYEYSSDVPQYQPGGRITLADVGNQLNSGLAGLMGLRASVGQPAGQPAEPQSAFDRAVSEIQAGAARDREMYAESKRLREAKEQRARESEKFQLEKTKSDLEATERREKLRFARAKRTKLESELEAAREIEASPAVSHIRSSDPIRIEFGKRQLAPVLARASVDTQKIVTDASLAVGSVRYFNEGYGRLMSPAEMVDGLSSDNLDVVVASVKAAKAAGIPVEQLQPVVRPQFWGSMEIVEADAASGANIPAETAQLIPGYQEASAVVARLEKKYGGAAGVYAIPKDGPASGPADDRVEYEAAREAMATIRAKVPARMLDAVDRRTDAAREGFRLFDPGAMTQEAHEARAQGTPAALAQAMAPGGMFAKELEQADLEFVSLLSKYPTGDGTAPKLGSDGIPTHLSGAQRESFRREYSEIRKRHAGAERRNLEAAVPMIAATMNGLAELDSEPAPADGQNQAFYLQRFAQRALPYLESAIVPAFAAAQSSGVVVDPAAFLDPVHQALLQRIQDKSGPAGLGRIAGIDAETEVGPGLLEAEYGNLYGPGEYPGLSPRHPVITEDELGPAVSKLKQLEKSSGLSPAAAAWLRRHEDKVVETSSGSGVYESAAIAAKRKADEADRQRPDELKWSRYSGGNVLQQRWDSFNVELTDAIFDGVDPVGTGANNAPAVTAARSFLGDPDANADDWSFFYDILVNKSRVEAGGAADSPDLSYINRAVRERSSGPYTAARVAIAPDFFYRYSSAGAMYGKYRNAKLADMQLVADNMFLRGVNAIAEGKDAERGADAILWFLDTQAYTRKYLGDSVSPASSGTYNHGDADSVDSRRAALARAAAEIDKAIENPDESDSLVVRKLAEKLKDPRNGIVADRRGPYRTSKNYDNPPTTAQVLADLRAHIAEVYDESRPAGAPTLSRVLAGSGAAAAAERTRRVQTAAARFTAPPAPVIMNPAAEMAPVAAAEAAYDGMLP